MPQFEIAVYNQEVRDRVRNGERHRDLLDEWADTHYIELTADNKSQAWAVANRKYPSNRGYVIESIHEP